MIETRAGGRATDNERFAWLRRYRAGGVALVVSLAAHAVLMGGLPGHVPVDRKIIAAYTATLEPAAVVVAPPTEAPAIALPAPAPRPVRPKSRPRAPAAVPDMLTSITAAEIAVPPALLEPAGDGSPDTALAAAEAPAPPEVVALAQPATPIPALEPPQFPVQGLPASLSIQYQINSAFADGQASYEWRREGDTYVISGEAEATGFFTLFLEGQIVQESRGTVTRSGLRPDSFRERKPQGASEGLDFDWSTRKVTFRRGDENRTSPLADNTVDWLSMIFQLAHVPPSTKSIDMQVFTQRKMYRFTLKVLGVEEIEIPLGRVKALHLRHEPTDAKEAVDVWLGLNQHYLPVKMRFPVARNRIMVDQVATSVTVR